MPKLIVLKAVVLRADQCNVIVEDAATTFSMMIFSMLMTSDQRAGCKLYEHAVMAELLKYICTLRFQLLLSRLINNM